MFWILYFTYKKQLVKLHNYKPDLSFDIVTKINSFLFELNNDKQKVGTFLFKCLLQKNLVSE